MWAVKDAAIGSTFFDAVAAQFFTPSLTQTRDRLDNHSTTTTTAAANRSTKGATKIIAPSKRLKYTVDESTVGAAPMSDTLGSALGPDWLATLNLTAAAGSTSASTADVGAGDGKSASKKEVTVEFETDVKAICVRDELSDEAIAKIVHLDGDSPIRDPWPVYVHLSNGKVYGCDLVVSATGVQPNSELFKVGSGNGNDANCNPIALADDGALKVQFFLACVVFFSLRAKCVSAKYALLANTVVKNEAEAAAALLRVERAKGCESKLCFYFC